MNTSSTFTAHDLATIRSAILKVIRDKCEDVDMLDGNPFVRSWDLDEDGEADKFVEAVQAELMRESK